MSYPPNYWEQSQPSVYPPGTNSLETRLRSSEIHLNYVKAHLEDLAQRLEQAEHREDERQEEMEKRLWRASMQVIGALISALLGLGFMVLKPLLHL